VGPLGSGIFSVSAQQAGVYVNGVFTGPSDADLTLSVVDLAPAAAHKNKPSDAVASSAVPSAWYTPESRVIEAGTGYINQWRNAGW
jgi:hypothetical protein